MEELISPQTAKNTDAIACLEWAVSVAHDRDLPRDWEKRKLDEAAWKSLEASDFRPHLDHLIVGRYVDEGLEALYQVGFLDVWIPELSAMVGFGDGEWKHKDVWKHTIQVVKQAVPRLAVRWGALLHDIGKIKTRAIDEKGNVTFYGHAELGASMYRRKLKKRLNFRGELSDRIHFLILYHLRPGSYSPTWTDSAVRRFYVQMGDGLKDLLDLGRADITTKRPEKKRRGVRSISALGKRIRELEAADSKVRPLPKGLGMEISKRFNIPPSKRLGDLMKLLEADADEGLIAGGGESELYLEYLGANRQKFGIE